MASGFRIEVEGLKELRTGLRNVDKELTKELRRLHKVTAERLAEKMRSTASGQGGVNAKAGRLVKARATQTEGRIEYGGAGYAMGAEFGALRYRQFRRWRGSGGGAGYFFWPTVREGHEEIAEEYEEQLTALIAKALSMQ